MSIKQYTKNGETLYKVRVRPYGDSGRRVCKTRSGIRTLSEAKRVEKQLELRAFHEASNKGNESLPWHEVVERWGVAAAKGDIFIKPLGRATIDDYVSILHKLAPDWLKLPSDQIDKASVWTKLNEIESEISISRRKRFRSAFDNIYRWGILKKIIIGAPTIPSEGYKSNLREVEKLPQILRLEDIRKLLAAAKQLESPWYPVWATALLTGCRSGELYALEWEQVDFEKKLVYIHRNWTNKTGFGPTKGRNWRTVPMNAQLESLLVELKNSRRSPRFVLPRFQSWKDGRQADQLRKFMKGVGLEPVKFHTLRACFATQLIADGIAPAQIMKICGWKDLKTMEKYIRLAGIDVKGATANLRILPEEAVLGRVVELFRDR